MRAPAVVLVLGTSVAACGAASSTADSGAAPGSPAAKADGGGGTGTSGVFQPGLQDDGAIAFERVIAAAKLPAEKHERVEISAPIWPKVLVMYAYEGASYPTTPEGQAKAAHDSALPFLLLLSECKAKYPTITPPAADKPLAPEQIANNYNEVARCAYEQFTAKPYWIPELVADVDICAAELGADWRLLTEADIAGFSPGELQFLRETLTATADGADFFGAFYYSLRVWAWSADKKLVVGSLYPDSAGVSPLPVTVDGTPLSHLESDLALRCIRVHMP